MINNSFWINLRCLDVGSISANLAHIFFSFENCDERDNHRDVANDNEDAKEKDWHQVSHCVPLFLAQFNIGISCDKNKVRKAKNLLGIK